jgi:voltage-gated potassium channel Kch
LNDQGVLGVPDHYFSQPTIGHDWHLNTADPGYLLFFKVPVDWVWGYGYGPPVAYATASYLFSMVHICSITPDSCGNVLFNLVIMLSFLGFLLFGLLVPKTIQQKITSVFFVLVFSFGIGMSRGFETGNLDLPISCLLLWTCYAIKQCKNRSSSIIMVAIVVGFISGFTSTIKLSVLPFVFLFFGAVKQKTIACSVAVLTFMLFSLVPHLYGVPTKITDMYYINEYVLSPMRERVFAEYPHGNMSLRATASGIYHGLAFDFSIPMRNVSILFIAAGLGIFITSGLFVFLCISLLNMRKEEQGISFIVTGIRLLFHKEYLHISFTYATIAIILVPIVAFEYRLIYLIGVYLLLFAEDTRKRTYAFFISLMFVGLKNSWILHGSMTTVLLYIGFWFLLLDVIHEHLNATKQVLDLKNSARDLL